MKGVEVRIKPLTIRAIQFTGDNLAEVVEWMADYTIAEEPHAVQRYDWPKPALVFADGTTLPADYWIVVQGITITTHSDAQFKQRFEIVS